MATPPPPSKPSPPRASGPLKQAPIKPGTSQRPQSQPPTQKPASRTGEDGGEPRTPCSPELCRKYCQPPTGSSVATKTHPRSLWRRFFEIPSNASQFVIQLLGKSYCENLTLDPSKYVWHAFDDREYAAGMMGLCGCTGIFIASEKGAFTAHVWEKDTKTDGDLRGKNYKATLETMKRKLSPHKDDLKGGRGIYHDA